MKIVKAWMAKIAAAVGILLLLTPLSASAVVLQPMQSRAEQSFNSIVPSVSSTDSFLYFNELTCRNNPMEGMDPLGLSNEPRIIDLTGQVYGQGYMNLGAAEDPHAYNIDARLYEGNAGAEIVLANRVFIQATPYLGDAGEIVVGTVWAPASWALDVKDVGLGMNDFQKGHRISGSIQVGASVIGFLPLGDIVKKPVGRIAKWAKRFGNAGGDEVAEKFVKETVSSANKVEAWRIVERSELEDIYLRGNRYALPDGKSTWTPIPDKTGKAFYSTREEALDTLAVWSRQDHVSTDWFLTESEISESVIDWVQHGVDDTVTMPLGKTVYFVEMKDLVDVPVKVHK